MAFTHYPGCMFITDQPAASKPLRSSPRVIRLSREGAPFFASVLGEEVGKLFPRLEQALLDDPTNTGVTQYFQVGTQPFRFTSCSQAQYTNCLHWLC